MYNGKKISLVIPAYNEQKLIIPTLENVPKTIDHIYVINDCSTDNMAEVVKKCAKKDKRIQLINHRKNHGVGAAIITGYLNSNKDYYDIAVVIGGDHQMDLKDLPNFLEPIISGEADYVKGNRFLYAGKNQNLAKPEVMPFQRLLGNSLLSALVKITSGYYKIFDTQDGYTAISKEAIAKVNWKYAFKGYGYPGDFIIVFNAFNLRIKDVPRRAIYLKGERQSQIKIFKYIKKVFPLYLKKFLWRLKYKYLLQDFHPLVFFYFSSFFIIPLGLILGLRVIYFALNGAAPTNETILSVLFLVTGIQFLLFAMFFEMQVNEKLQP
ncbi:MAG: glycosyltransferase family 2 protein [Nanoarchaeota archaeon]|nr:glycosyltransferase family 2 protein [Nanoarchaeota archaeon]